jgi:serine/threonine-protein kinase
MTDLDPLIGAVLDGRYRVLGQLGAGGMGTVYRAEQTNVGREVAIKVLMRGLSEDAGVVQRFQNEAKIIAQLRSPHTLRLIDSGATATKQLYIVTELLVGETLNVALKRGAVGDRRTLEIIRQVCHSLEEAHAKGIIHRDLKPANVFIEQIETHEHVKILDFGIAKLSEQPAMTATGMVFGTPAYMSPEQARGERVTAKSDLYSIGVIAYECVGGRPPFVAESVVSLLLKHTTDPPPPFAEIGATVSLRVELLLMKLLAKDPNQRPANAAAVRQEAEAILASLPAPSVSSPVSEAALREPITKATAPVSVPPSITDLRPGRKRTNFPLLMALVALWILGSGVALLIYAGASEVGPEPVPAEAYDPVAELGDEAGDEAAAGDDSLPEDGEDVVDLAHGTVNGLSPDASQEEIKEILPYFTGSTPETDEMNHGGGVFFTQREMYFYTRLDMIEIRRAFRGEVRPPVLGAMKWKAVELLGEPLATHDDAIYYSRRYGCVRLELDGDAVKEIDISAKPCSDLLPR